MNKVLEVAVQTLYVGMGLTQAPNAFRVFFQKALKDDLRASRRFEVLDFIGLTAGDDVLVYREDRKKTESADVCLFIVDHSSTGLGMDIAFRLATGKPMRVCAHKDVHITRRLTGMCEDEQVPFFRYTSSADIMRTLIYDPTFRV